MNNVVYEEACGLQIVEREYIFFIRYDPGAHQECWREDEISKQTSSEFINGTKAKQHEILINIQKQLKSKGYNPYQSNWSPYKKSTNPD